MYVFIRKVFYIFHRYHPPGFFKSINESRIFVVHYVYVPPNLVLVHTEDITKRKTAEENLRLAHDRLENTVRDRTEALAEANEALKVERETLHQKNLALQAILDEIEKSKQEMASQIQGNIDRIAMPILDSLERRAGETEKTYIQLLRSNLKDISSPLIRHLEIEHTRLTTREREICNMVRQGLTCKDIAATLNTSVQTVLKQRAMIRKKLGIANKRVNLASYLNTMK